MQTSDNGVNLIKRFEGLRLQAYQDAVGVWTIGYGHTGPEVHAGLCVSDEQAEQLLRQDLSRFEQGVASLVKVALNQNQFDALISFSYNLGLGNLQSSTLLRLLNQGDYQGAAGQFPLWDKAGGKTEPGLQKRRQAEQALFGTPSAAAA
ncbi:muraminidase [Chromobacterium phragmitis]|uniref:Lysozyme n=1 Tax=Chromobacterium phragmitis TaxID=2202141 RepID=A0A344UFE0_9NEIS|nr:lysozyme [Chromobacterium phragmitis]AXE28664.1 muraminidase [Chromobacterium phragmitis]AXE33988.1 muraminidase [Chromobacterium phragmitis]